MAIHIADLFEHVVDVVPDRPALIADDARLSYGQLDAAANRWAHYLVSAGVAPGEHVGLMARSTAEHAAAMLGCFKARAVPINVNYRYVPAELDYLADNAELVALVHEARFAPVLDEVVPHRRRLREVVVVDDGTGIGPSAYTATVWDDVVLAGNRAAQAVVRTTAVDADGQVHFTVLPGSVTKNRHLLGRTVA